MTFVESASHFMATEKLLCTKCRKTCWHDTACTNAQRTDICFYHCPRCPSYNLCRDCYPTRHDFVFQCQQEVKEEVLAEASIKMVKTHSTKSKHHQKVVEEDVLSYEVKLQGVKDRSYDIPGFQKLSENEQKVYAPFGKEEDRLHLRRIKLVG